MIAEITSQLPMVMLSTMSPDGHVIAMTDQQQVEIWDAGTGRLESRLALSQGSRYTVTHLEFDGDGTRLLTSGGQLEPVARTWDTSTGRLLMEFHGHTHGITRAHFSPDGRLIVTASQDNTAGTWDSHSGRRVMTLQGNRNMLFDAIFSPDGRRVLTSGSDGSARIYDVSLARALAELLPVAGQRHTRALTPQEAAQFLH
jgi:WD40 repeat protein